MKKTADIKGSFDRKTKPATEGQDKALPLGWFSVSHRWVPEGCRKELRGKWCKISSASGSCFRALRMDPQLKGSPGRGSGEIQIDWDGWLTLTGYGGADVNKALELTIRPVSRLEFLRVGHGHPDPGIRAAAVVASISLGLGLLALVISISQAFI